ncbi:hypothetical protein BgiMline_036619 [Biomphalaria glabrata]|nr:hypothetical protein BgiMline_015102 [Biomphalaria glabrata]
MTSSLKNITVCKKQATLSKLIPVKGITKSHLPESYQDNKDIFNFLMALADLTVKITTSFTSPNRPETYPDTDVVYPFQDMWGSGKERVATGWVDQIKRYSEKENLDCRCPKCRSSETPSKVWGDVTIVTNTHNVFDRFEAEKSTCWLFYNDEAGPVTALKGRSMSYADMESGRSALVCSTCDMELLEKLSHALLLCEELKRKIEPAVSGIPIRPEESIIISHPHGCPKHFWFGTWKPKTENGKAWYATPICSGNDGAPLVILGEILKPSYWPYSGPSCK